MDGAKAITDTTDQSKTRGRQAFCEGKNISEKRYEPRRNENPGSSKILAERESLSPKGQGFLDNVDQSRVS